MRAKTINQISAQLERIHEAAYWLYIRPMYGNPNKGWSIQEKARQIADRYYLNIWNELGAVCHSDDENICKQIHPSPPQSTQNKSNP
uniref:Uncharacterized protein n=1 Tax=virus sp. ctoYX9 TaxID=2825822 RepID=A0A8S5RNU4_9VIRU|nr:MAG TPA: hypothetical protein [virus sp. ctoYX9]